MSAKMMGLIWDLKLPHPEQLVLLAMVDHADHKGNNIFPSVGLIAWKTGYSHRQTQRIIKELINKDILILNIDEGIRGTKKYSVSFENVILKSPYTGKDKLSPKKRHKILLMLLKLYDNKCVCCKLQGTDATGPDGNPWDIDRIIPGIRGGKYTEDNIVLSCHTCNIKKGPNKSSRLANNNSMGGDTMTPPYVGGDVGVPRGVTPDADGGDTQMSPESSLTIKEPSFNLRAFNHHYITMIDVWRGLFPKKPRPRPGTMSIRNKVRTRMKDKHFAGNWRASLERASKSTFLHKSPWFDFGWFVQNDNNYQKMLNGKYDDGKDNSRDPQTRKLTGEEIVRAQDAGMTTEEIQQRARQALQGERYQEKE